MTLRIGTRGSDLALWQARFVAEHLRVPSAIVTIRTEGDRITDVPLHEVTGIGFFTKEVERALCDRIADIAVHSYKDLPIALHPDLVVAAVPVRAPVHDCLVVRADSPPMAGPVPLPPGATVGTSSLRRKAQLRALRPDLDIVDLRGNVPTRLQRVRRGELSGVMLAEAGLSRLGYTADPELRCVRIATQDICPAPSQGALAIQVRRDDAAALAAVAPLHDRATAAAVDVERRLLAYFGGGCNLPLGALCIADEERFDLSALVAAPDGHERLAAHAQHARADVVVREVYDALVARGAEKYL